MKSSTEKGTELEDQVFELISKMLKNDDFIVSKKLSKVYKKKGYFSAKRGKDIVFDVTIETTQKGADKYSMLTIIECKNLNKRVTVDDIEEFGSKINQVGEHNTKGILITTHSFQKSALEIAKKEGIGLVRLNSSKEIQWINYRKNKDWGKVFENDAELTDNKCKNEPFVCKVGNKKITNFADLLLEYSILDYFNDSEEFIDIPYVSDEKIESIVDKLLKYDLYDNNYLNFDKLIPFLEERYKAKFILDSSETDGYLGKIEFNPLCIRVPKNASTDMNRWRFTLAHEIGHLILHSKILQDRLNHKEDNENSLSLKYSYSKSNSDRLEIQANLFASALLLPVKKLLPRMNSIFIEYRIPKRQLFLDKQPVNKMQIFEILDILSKEFQTSTDAIKIRLIRLELLVDETDTRFKSLLKKLF